MNPEAPRVGEILVVEDSDSDFDLLEMGYQRLPFQKKLHRVEDGHEAMDFVLRKEPFADAPRPDLILLDLNLPVRHGHEVLQAIKTNCDLASIPVVILSTSKYIGDISKSYQRHANGYLAKDFGLEILGSLRTLSEFWFSTALLPTGKILPPEPSSKAREGREPHNVALQCLHFDACTMGILESAAARLGFNLPVADVGTVGAARTQLAGKDPDTTLVTLAMMPDRQKDTEQLLVELRSLGELQSAPLLACAEVSVGAGLVETCYRNHVNAVIPKPTNETEAVATLGSLAQWYSMIQ